MSTDTTTDGSVLRALGFCGADDSVHPNLLGLIALAYPTVEFGVLFRPDREGQPRYATSEWVDRLSRVARKNPTMKLAAHLCGSRVDEVLKGNDAFLSLLSSLGFRRVQINATAVNGVDTSRLKESVPAFLRVIRNHPNLEFVLQRNQETEPLWGGVLREAPAPLLPPNLSMLVDESKGTGVLASNWPSPPDEGYRIGYAGGIGPTNVRQVLSDVQKASSGRSFWIDMESSLRSTKNGADVFDLYKCYEVIAAACDAGLVEHPDSLA
jgi:phosphoribosylanthranilate isomerase